MSSDVQAKWMNAVEVARRGGDAFELLPQVVLDGLDVVVRLGLERLDALRVVDAELVDDVVQHVFDRRLERRELDDARLVREVLQPAHLDQRAIADQRVLGKVFAQRCGFARVAAVERRKCEKRGCVQRAAEAYTSVFGVRIIHRDRCADRISLMRALVIGKSPRSRHGGRFSRRARQHGRAAGARVGVVGRANAARRQQFSDQRLCECRRRSSARSALIKWAAARREPGLGAACRTASRRRSRRARSRSRTACTRSSSRSTCSRRAPARART